MDYVESSCFGPAPQCAVRLFLGVPVQLRGQGGRFAVLPVRDSALKQQEATALFAFYFLGVLHSGLRSSACGYMSLYGNTPLLQFMEGMRRAVVEILLHFFC